MTWVSGRRELKQYGSYQQGLNACKWTLKNSPSWADKKYMEMTIPEMAKLYTGNDSPTSWASNAVHCIRSTKELNNNYERVYNRGDSRCTTISKRFR